AALGLHFGHVNAPVNCAREAFAQKSANLLAPSHFFCQLFQAGLRGHRRIGHRARLHGVNHAAQKKK
ncbi:MAG: hypothetical protein RSC66_04720, partial [Comamonas sp.]